MHPELLRAFALIRLERLAARRLQVPARAALQFDVRRCFPLPVRFQPGFAPRLQPKLGVVDAGDRPFDAMQSLSLPSFSDFLHLCLDKNAWCVQASVALAYVLFYTAYDKSTKSLSMSLLLDFLLMGQRPAKAPTSAKPPTSQAPRGLTWALNEWNKLISLVAITR